MPIIRSARLYFGTLQETVAILSTGGAKVVLFIMPYLDPPEEAANGDAVPRERPVAGAGVQPGCGSVADDGRDVVALADLNRLVDPGGRYRSVVSGVTVRSTDGVHLTIAGLEWLQPDVIPTVASLGLATEPSVVGDL